MNPKANRGQSPISNSGSDPDFLRTALRVSAGVIIWVLHFTAIYGVTALACARGWTALVAPAIGIATALAVIALLAFILAGWRRRTVFEYWLSASVAGFALVAVIYEAYPVLVIPTCG